MKLSEIKGKKALETTADLIEPLAHILADGSLSEAIKAQKPVLHIVKMLLKNWPDDVITILALLDGKDPETYEVNMLTLPIKLIEVLNDQDVKTLFFSLDQTEE